MSLSKCTRLALRTIRKLPRPPPSYTPPCRVPPFFMDEGPVAEATSQSSQTSWNMPTDATATTLAMGTFPSMTREQQRRLETLRNRATCYPASDLIAFAHFSARVCLVNWCHSQLCLMSSRENSKAWLLATFPSRFAFAPNKCLRSSYFQLSDFGRAFRGQASSGTTLR